MSPFRKLLTPLVVSTAIILGANNVKAETPTQIPTVGARGWTIGGGFTSFQHHYEEPRPNARKRAHEGSLICSGVYRNKKKNTSRI